MHGKVYLCRNITGIQVDRIYDILSDFCHVNPFWKTKKVEEKGFQIQAVGPDFEVFGPIHNPIHNCQQPTTPACVTIYISIYIYITKSRRLVIKNVFM